MRPTRASDPVRRGQGGALGSPCPSPGLRARQGAGEGRGDQLRRSPRRRRSWWTRVAPSDVVKGDERGGNIGRTCSIVQPAIFSGRSSGRPAGCAGGGGIVSISRECLV